jgi:RHS repeat-associated protein
VFDTANRLVETNRDGTALQPVYNGVGDRVAQMVGVTTTYFVLDVIGLPEVIQTSEGNSYLHLPGVIVAESAGGEVRYLLSDGLGSVRQAVDDTGQVVMYNEYDPYGNPVQNGGESYGYTGEWWQDEVGLLHLRARWYWPETGTFLSVDPVESEPPYLYVRGNVVNLIDPNGQAPIPISACEEGCQQVDQGDGYWQKLARIDCYETAQAGGMRQYLQQEAIKDPAAVLTRLAMTENNDRTIAGSLDRRYVMWTVRFRMAIGYSYYSGGDKNGNPETTLWAEVSRESQYAGIQAILNISTENLPGQAEDWKCGGDRNNIKAGYYPCDSALNDFGPTVQEWIMTYPWARIVLKTDRETLSIKYPEQLRASWKNDEGETKIYGYDSFKWSGASKGTQKVAGGNKYTISDASIDRSKWIWP